MNAVVSPMPADADLRGVHVADGAAVAVAAFLAGFTYPKPMTVSEWADAHRKLPRAAASEPGQWRTDRTPYLREIMDSLSNTSDVREIALMKSTQVGGTEVLINWVCYVIAHNPCSMMVVLPTIEVGEKWSKQRLAPLTLEMPELASRISPARARDSGNTTREKVFEGGVLFIAGANSASSLMSAPIKYLARDEIDQYPDDLDEQGGALDISERRTSTYPRRKILDVSSPTIKDSSAIEKRYLGGDQRQYHVPCPHCAHEQTLVIDQLTDDGQYLCLQCGVLIAEHHKTAMLAAGRWIAGKPERERRSYHLNALYSPLGLGYSWAEIATMRAEARKDADKEVTFSNTILGLPYAGAGQRVEANELSERREKWQRRTLPRGALIITVGIDVQHNRFAVLTTAWGRNEQCWFVDWVEVPGDPTKDEDWRALEESIFQPIINGSGVALRPSVYMVDSGNWTHEVYNWARRHQGRGVFAIKGSNQPNRPVVGRPTAQDVKRGGKVYRHGVQLWTVGVHTVKTTLVARLIGDAGLDVDTRRMHFPEDMPLDFFEQLVSEFFDTKRKRWIKKPGARNEAFDCLVYAYAAACHPLIRLHVMREHNWAALERKLEPTVGDMFVAPAEGEAPDQAEAATTPEPEADASRETSPAPAAPVSRKIAKHQPRRGGWMNRN